MSDAPQEPILAKQKTVHRVVKVKPNKKYKAVCGPPNAFTWTVIMLGLMVLTGHSERRVILRIWWISTSVSSAK